MGSCQMNGGGWFMDYGIEGEVQATDFIWARQMMDDPSDEITVHGVNGVSHGEMNHFENTSTNKRDRLKSCGGTGTKACREKKRRDKLNDRFVELSSILDPRRVDRVRPLKADKFAILSDATHCLKQLLCEVEKLKESNEALQATIKSLKAEKVELRDEKAKLKTEKERLKQQLKGMSIPSPFISHPACATAFHPAAFAGNKTVPLSSYPVTAMWQWMPPAACDTSHDHVLRPPVA